MRRSAGAAALAAVVLMSAAGCSTTKADPVEPGDGCCINGEGVPVFGDVTTEENPDAPIAAPDPEVESPVDPADDEQADESAAVPCYTAAAAASDNPPYPGLTLSLELKQQAGVAGSFLSGTLTVTNNNDFPVNYYEQPPPYSIPQGSGIELLVPGTNQVVGAAPLKPRASTTATQVALPARGTRAIPVSVPLRSCHNAAQGQPLPADDYEVRVGIRTQPAGDRAATPYFWYADREPVKIVSNQ